MNPLEIIVPERLAIVWTRDKVCTQPQWQLTRSFLELHGDHASQVFGQQRELGYEPAITLRTSGLVGVELDGPDDQAVFAPLFEEMGAKPLLVELNSKKPARAHLYFRRRRELSPEEDVSFRFEGGVVTGAINNYYRCLGGDDYARLRYTPEAQPLGELQYQHLVDFERKSESKFTAAIRSGKALPEGSRRCTAYRLACALFLWTDDEELVTDMVDLWSQMTCDPPLTHSQVLGQVRGAYRRRPPSVSSSGR